MSEEMYRLLDRAWDRVRDSRAPGTAIIRGNIVGTLKRINSARAEKMLKEIERVLQEERRRRTAAPR